MLLSSVYLFSTYLACFLLQSRRASLHVMWCHTQPTLPREAVEYLLHVSLSLSEQSAPSSDLAERVPDPPGVVHPCLAVCPYSQSV